MPVSFDPRLTYLIVIKNKTRLFNTREVLAENGVMVCHYFNPGDAAIQASCSRRALERPVPGQDAMLAHPLVQGILCDKTRR